MLTLLLSVIAIKSNCQENCEEEITAIQQDKQAQFSLLMQQGNY